VKIREHGVRYEVSFTDGHKTGFFCDQRDNRRNFGKLAEGRTVLDLCCYTGGFALGIGDSAGDAKSRYIP
jgi:23S rRNA (cytosine1962-C5)-methyltransferase